MGYKNYVFDMGKVLIDYDIDNVIRLYTEDENSIKEVESIVFLSGEWTLLDAGLIAEEDALNCMLQRASTEKIRQIIIDSFLNWHKYNMRPKKGMAELLDVLKENKKKIYVLSNANSRLPLCYKDYMPRAELYDGVLFSTEVKYIKPQKDIYEVFFQKFQLKPSECYFIDDRKDNILGAKECGMDGEVFDGDVQKLYDHICKIEDWKK